MRFIILILVFLIISVLNVHSQINKSSLDLNEIMKGDEFIGHQPENIRWSDDSQFLFFDWNRHNNAGSSTYAYNLQTKQIDSVTFDFQINNITNNASIINQECFILNGQLYKRNLKTRKNELVFSQENSIYGLSYATLEKSYYFQSNQGVYSYNPITGSILQIVQFTNGTAPVADTKNSNNHLHNQELDHFQYLQDQKRKDEWKKEAKQAPDRLKTIYTGKMNVSNIQISMDGNFLTYRLNDYGKDELTEVMHYISESGHASTKKARSKVSNNDPDHELMVYNLKTDSSYKVDFSVLSEIRKKPTYYSEFGDKSKEFDADRKIIMHELVYPLSNGNPVLDIRSYDNKDRWIVQLNLIDGTLIEIERQHDEAWIGGPGISGWNMVSGTLDYLNDGTTIYFQSEKTGYSHLYTYNTKTKQKTQITEGSWEVYNVQKSNKSNILYVTANKTHPGDRGLYKLNLLNNELTEILVKEGAYDAIVSPNEKKIGYLFSTKTSPWELFITDNVKNATPTKITNSSSEKFKSYNWHSPEVISFKANDGKDVYARVYEPTSESKNGAAVIFVHGAGYLQNAHNYWSTYHREYMFHNLLRDNGFTVIDVDYRASEGYGRDHRTGIYRHMGGKDLSDQIDAKNLLVNKYGIDPNRVGIYGGSYGGFITLMALFTQPEEFKCGAALRSVTDWNHYNHEYTSNILNYPGTDSLAYFKSSPINFAQNLSKRLLILHGMIDDNVQFQDVVRLSQKLIELKKKNWELAVFPIESHGFKTTTSWIDEYSRIYKLFCEELIDQ